MLVPNAMITCGAPRIRPPVSLGLFRVGSSRTTLISATSGGDRGYIAICSTDAAGAAGNLAGLKTP